MSSSAAAAAATSYWCYRCSRFVRVWSRDAPVCPACDGGFLEEVDTPPPRLLPEPRNRRRFHHHHHHHHHRPSSSSSAAAPAPNTAIDRSTLHRSRRSNRLVPAGDRSPFNPVIVLRSPQDTAAAPNRTAPGVFDLYYEDGAGTGLRPLPSSMSEFLMGSGFDRLLEQLSHIGIHGTGAARTYENQPASKAAIDSMPTIKITPGHIKTDSHCAVCMESFELGTDAREMPCKHIYHQECILPWLTLHNSCPVCRHEMPSELRRRGRAGSSSGDELALAGGSGEEGAVGLTIWRLPGGGFAVGRFSGGRRDSEQGLPVVYTEMDGRFNGGGVPRRIAWSQRENRPRQSGGGIGGAFRNFLSMFSCFGNSSPASSSRPRPESGTSASHRSLRAPVLDSSRTRRRSSWTLEDGNGNEIARW